MATELVYGRHAVAALCRTDPAGVTELWVQAERREALIDEVVATLERLGVAVHRVPRKTLDRLSGGARHQGVAARYRASTRRRVSELDDVLGGARNPLLLVLDRVQDPHNVGACLRTADAAGAHALVVPRHRAAGLTPAARKVASGAAEHVPVLAVSNLGRALAALDERGVRVVGTAADAPVSLYELDLRGPLAVVVGGEESGLRRLTREHCHVLARIPMAGAVGSLNVSVAAGVCLFEAARQRRGEPPG